MKPKNLENGLKEQEELTQGRKYCDYINKCGMLCYEHETNKCRSKKFYDKYGVNWTRDYLGV